MGYPAQKKPRSYSAWDIRLAMILFARFQKEAYKSSRVCLVFSLSLWYALFERAF